ncbi:hypothetical protein MRB53_023711 [Persea americana]|uniref:Uncharacterized protein n=1 Tax=Persea americana TaxID=3435 RepID=A0ACC2LBE0_PERAE|nr:hypothetical protein MRB53_023711 [Persea americana]
MCTDIPNVLQVIKYLVDNTNVEINTVNTDSCTALDVSLETTSGYRRWWTTWILIGAGAEKGPYKRTKKKPYENASSWFREALLVLATLMTTVAFQAGLNPPGGVWQDTGLLNYTLPDQFFNVTSTQSSHPKLVPHLAGESFMSSVEPELYLLFCIFNSLTLLSSMLLIILLLLGFSSNSMLSLSILTGFSIFTMLLTYQVSLAFVSSDAVSQKILWVREIRELQHIREVKR